MSEILNRLAAFFMKPAKETAGQAPEGICPNCWGKQEYGDQVRELYKDQQVDVNNHQANYAFVQRIMVTHLQGIQLTRGNDGLTCPTCHTRYPNQ